MTANQISYAKLLEDKRHNAAMESETVRTNKANESIKIEANTISKDKMLNDPSNLLWDTIRSFIGKDGDAIRSGLESGKLSVANAVAKINELAYKNLSKDAYGKLINTLQSWGITVTSKYGDSTSEGKGEAEKIKVDRTPEKLNQVKEVITGQTHVTPDPKKARKLEPQENQVNSSQQAASTGTKRDFDYIMQDWRDVNLFKLKKKKGD